jgi:hypothetical protein
MSKRTPQAASPHERLRQQWLQQAEAVFELLFDPEHQDQLVTFDQREERVIALTRELSTWLLEQHAAGDPAVRLPQDQTAACPKCGRPAQRRTPAGAALPSRPLTCEDGEILLRREQWHCKTCRVSFFPSGPPAATGDRRL